MFRSSLSPCLGRPLLSALLLGLSGTALQAQDAGQLMQQQNRKAPPMPARGDTPPPQMAPAIMNLPQGARINVKRFVFRGNKLLDDAQLQAAVSGHVGRSLGIGELNNALALVAARYVAAGRLARCYLPAQDVTEGVITVQVQEAQYGGTAVERSGARTDAQLAAAMIDAGQQRGAALDMGSLERSLLLLGDRPGVKPNASLMPGAAPGETKVALSLQDKPLLSGEVGADNAGTRATGEARLNAQLALNSPFGMGDLFNAQLSHSKGSDYLRAGFSLPLGLDGWRIGANTAGLRYELVGSDFSALNASGRSYVSGVDASYPLIRSRDTNLLLLLGHDRKRYRNEANGNVFSRYRSTLSSLSLHGNRYDDLGGGGVSNALLSVQFGDLDLNGSPSQLVDAAGLRTEGSFRKLRYLFSRRQALAPGWSMLAVLNGQWANRNLDSSEKFYLGGPQGVRAYPSGEAGGARGMVLNLELQQNLESGLSWAAFVDAGRAQINVDNGFLGAASPNRVTLKGLGLRVGYASDGLGMDLIWARRIDDNPLADARGRDQDGSLRRNRFWLTASYSF